MKLHFWYISVVLVLFQYGLCYVTKIRRRSQISSRMQRINTHKIITLDIMIHFDNDILKKLPEPFRKEPKRYLRLLARRIIYDAEYILRHLHSKETFRLHLIDAIFLENDVKAVEKGDDVLKYLKTYCKWQSKNKMRGKRYFSVLFSGIDLAFVNSKGERNRKSTGRSFFGGTICSHARSCTVIEWHRRNSGYLLAHEIAHNLGVFHNGAPYNDCNTKGYVMSSSYDRKKPPVMWSSCSRDAIHTFLKSSKAWCLKRK